MDSIFFVFVEFWVSDFCFVGGELDVIVFYVVELIGGDIVIFGVFGEYGVVVGEFVGEDVGEDFKVVVGVGWEVGLGFYVVFVEDVEGVEVGVGGVVLVCKGEGVVGV